MMTKIAEKSGEMLQNFKPINAIHCHLSAFHCYSDDRNRHVAANHYCSHLSEDFIQCVIYDAQNTRLIGIEYVVSKSIFDLLPDEEKAYWHPHNYEVKSGLVIAKGVPGPIEDTLMKKLVNTYGKTWHFWQVDRGDAVPVGPAKLMSSYTSDGQLPDIFIKERDLAANTDTYEKRQRRADFDAFPPDPRALG